MQIREMSDIHNEFGIFDMPITDEDKERTLVLAGDIDAAKNVERNWKWINDKGNYFKHVIYICGNHEFYHGDHDDVVEFYKMVNWLPNVHFLNHDYINLDGVLFWGGTLWTGLKGGNDWAVIKRLERGMNDFRLIRKRTELKTSKRVGNLFSPYDMIEIFNENKPKLFEAVKTAKANGMKTVVITHHAPASESIHKHYRGHDMNDGYCMYLDNEIVDGGPDLWFHGHTHVSVDYKCGNTRVVCNTRGYVNHEENRDFNPNLVIEI